MANGASAADGRCAWVAAWVGLVVGQLHALSRFPTAEGAEDLALPATAASAVPAAEALSPVLGWGDADLVYVTYGKIWVGTPGILPFAPGWARSGHAVWDGGDHARTIRRLGHRGSYFWNAFPPHDQGGRHRQPVLGSVGSSEGR